jgi:hypothetical protein
MDLGVRVVVDALSDCQVAAGKLKDLINTGLGRAAKDEIALARDLALKTDNLSGQLQQDLGLAYKKATSRNDPPLELLESRYGQLSSSFGSLAEVLRDDMIRLGEQIKSETARAALWESGSMVENGVLDTLIKQRKDGHPFDNAYTQIRQGFADIRKNPQVPLGNVWRLTRDFVQKQLDNTARPGQNQALADAFKKDFGNSGLAEAMDKWVKVTPADAPTLAWALAVKLREHKAAVAETLKIRPDLAEFLGYCLDAITEGVTEDVQALDKLRQ